MSRVIRFAALFLFATGAVQAETQVTYRRADGQVVHAVALEANGAACAPLAIVSHGLGGSSSGNRPLAGALNHAGYRVILPNHAESGPRLLMTAMRSGNGLDGIAAAAADPAATKARQADLDAILAVEEKRCRLPNKLLAGHSMGAREALIEAGARNSAQVAGKDRFDLYIAVSAEGEGTDFFPSGAMSGIRKPVMIITGTEDRSVDGGFETRMTTFANLPPGRKRAAIIRGATHRDLGGNGDLQVGATVGSLTVEFARAITPGPFVPAQHRQGVLIKDK